ncbi:hypothetical protein ON010_g8676 [Phytophthora cinnamomi]|nr:hypothetical protein ON010_g8676 [Phytophthora cinnamomi]
MNLHVWSVVSVTVVPLGIRRAGDRRVVRQPAYLQAACRAENNTVLPVSYAAPDTVGGSRLVEELRQCPDSRLLPDWVFDSVMYDIQAKKRTTYFEPPAHADALPVARARVQATKRAVWPVTKPEYLLAPGLGAVRFLTA